MTSPGPWAEPLGFVAFLVLCFVVAWLAALGRAVYEEWSERRVREGLRQVRENLRAASADLDEAEALLLGCPHLSMTAEVPEPLNLPTRWRCDSCGVLLVDLSTVDSRRVS